MISTSFTHPPGQYRILDAALASSIPEIADAVTADAAKLSAIQLPETRLAICYEAAPAEAQAYIDQLDLEVLSAGGIKRGPDGRHSNVFAAQLYPYAKKDAEPFDILSDAAKVLPQAPGREAFLRHLAGRAQLVRDATGLGRCRVQLRICDPGAFDIFHRDDTYFRGIETLRGAGTLVSLQPRPNTPDWDEGYGITAAMIELVQRRSDVFTDASRQKAALMVARKGGMLEADKVLETPAHSLVLWQGTSRKNPLGHAEQPVTGPHERRLIAVYDI